MSRVRPASRVAAAALVALAAANRSVVAAAPIVPAGTFADQVVSYDPGANRFQFNLYTNPGAALGAPQTSTGGAFVVTPFNNPFSRNDVVSVGLGGQITLRLARFAHPISGAPEIGVFTFQQFLQSTTGGTDTGPTLFYPSMRAKIDVSQDGGAWVALHDGNVTSFDIPANAYRDPAATLLSDYGLPFTGGLDALRNRASFADTLWAYQGSAGGTWIDISDTGLPEVAFVRFSVPPTDAFSFQLESVSVSTAAAGAPTPEPGCTGLILFAWICPRRPRRAV
ncbi:MAG TPA: hypothetical protein VH475_22095 [Tepidisphaeraceae bacterium]|jgi:hypothetical protein